MSNELSLFDVFDSSFDLLFKDFSNSYNLKSIGNNKTLELDMPGYKVSKVEVEGRTLRVSAELDPAIKNSSKKDKFEWSTFLPFVPDSDKMSAECYSGTLVIIFGDVGITGKKIKQIPVKTS